jgi:hypothetical protein
MKVGLGIPFWGDDETRITAYKSVYARLKEMYLWDVIIGGTWGLQPHRGKARNAIVEQFKDFDVIVLCDADSYPQEGPLKQAIEDAYVDYKIHFPHTTIWQLDSQGGLKYPYGPSAGGCWVFRPETWAYLGGMEERGGWSVDDRSFLEVMKTFELGPVYHRGVLTCLWHATEARIVPPEDKAIIQEYLDLSGKPLEMRRYLNARR